jgi:hypothetical protein
MADRESWGIPILTNMSQEIEYFATMPDAIDPVEHFFYSRMIRHNPENGKDELILYKNKSGLVGETVKDTVTFKDPETFRCAIDQLDEIGTAVVTGMGVIRHEHHIWNHTETPEEWFDTTEDENRQGMITCILRIKNGSLCPCEPKITKSSQ